LANDEFGIIEGLYREYVALSDEAVEDSEVGQAYHEYQFFLSADKQVIVVVQGTTHILNLKRFNFLPT
jgi:hypothetical protein